MGNNLRVALAASVFASALAIPATASADEANAAVPVSTQTARDPSGEYHRKNGDLVKVWVADGKLFCKIVEGKKTGFEMCHGMTPDGAAWTGKHMKHPGMPGFMTFNGTVTSDDQSIKIKGCAFGHSMCDSEIWNKVT